MENTEIKVNVEKLEGNVLHIKEEQLQTKSIYKGNIRRYNISSVNSVIDLVKEKGSQEKSIIFVGDKQIKVIFDDTVQDRELDELSCNFKLSKEFEYWLSHCGKYMSQKDLADFLKKCDGEFVGAVTRDVLRYNIQNIKVNKEVKGDFIQNDDGSTTYVFKDKNLDGRAYVPPEFTVKLPVLNGCELLVDVEFELEIDIPREEGEKPTFCISCPRKDRYIEQGIASEKEKLIEELDGYLVVDGSY